MFGLYLCLSERPPELAAISDVENFAEFNHPQWLERHCLSREYVANIDQ